MADQDELVALAAQLGHFHMDLGDQRTGGVEDLKAPALGLGLHGAADAVGAEDQHRPRRHIGQIVDEHGTALPQIVDDVAVVHDLVAHIDGRAKLGQRALDDLDCPVHPRAKAARLGQQHLLDGGAHHSTPMMWTSNRTGWPARGWLKSNNTAPSSRTSRTRPA